MVSNRDKHMWSASTHFSLAGLMANDKGLHIARYLSTAINVSIPAEKTTTNLTAVSMMPLTECGSLQMKGIKGPIRQQVAQSVTVRHCISILGTVHCRRTIYTCITRTLPIAPIIDRL